MNLILFEPDEQHDGIVVLEGRRAAHVHSVHRVSPGDMLRVGALGGAMGTAEVLEVSADVVRLRIIELDRTPPEPLQIVLVLALPRPKVINRTLAAVASLGVKKIEIINSWRVEKSYWSTPRLQPARLREQLILGLEQGVDTIIPSVRTHRFFRRFVEDELHDIAAGDPILVAHPHAARPAPEAKRCVLIVGPEGGFIEDELRLLQDHGATMFRAGDRILRVETAVPWLIARLS